MGRRKRRGLPVPAGVERALDSALDRAIAVQQPVVTAYVDRVRRQEPDTTPAQLVARLERHFRAAVVGIGGASGAAAAVPGAGTVASLATGAAEIGAFVGATAMYVLALADVYDLPVSDPEVRRALVLSVLVGEGAGTAMEQVERGAGSARWADVLTRSSTREHIGGINGYLGRLLVRRVGTRQGALLFGRALPLGVGAAIGAGGNLALARGVIRTARRAFGPPPARLHSRVVDA